MNRRLTEAQALARCDDLELQGRPREVYALQLVCFGSGPMPKGGNRFLAEVLQAPINVVYLALCRADKAVLVHEKRQAEAAARVTPAIPGEGPDSDPFAELGINRHYLREGDALRFCIANVTPSEPSSPLRGIKPSDTQHIDGRVRATRLSRECYAQIAAGTLRSPRFGELVEEAA